jgi:hypothetical protein
MCTYADLFFVAETWLASRLSPLLRVGRYERALASGVGVSAPYSQAGVISQCSLDLFTWMN